MPYVELVGTEALPWSVVLAGLLALTILAGVIDVLGKNASSVRRLPHWAWLLMVVALPLVGLLAWVLFGRPRRRRPRPTQSDRVISAFPEYDRKGRFVPTDPEADAAFLQQCRERAQQQRLQAEVERRRREARGD